MDNITESEIYQDERAKFSILKPTNWVVHNTPQYAALLVSPKLDQNSPQGQGYLGIMVNPLPQDTDDMLDEGAQEFFAIQAPGGPEFSATLPRKINLGNAAAWMQHSSWGTPFQADETSDTNLRANQVLFLCHSQGFMYIFKALFYNDPANEIWNTLKNLLQTVRFGPVSRGVYTAKHAQIDSTPESFSELTQVRPVVTNERFRGVKRNY